MKLAMADHCLYMQLISENLRKMFFSSHASRMQNNDVYIFLKKSQTISLESDCHNI